MGTKLTKSNRDRKICGVCGGIAEYLNCDSTIMLLRFGTASLFRSSDHHASGFRTEI